VNIFFVLYKKSRANSVTACLTKKVKGHNTVFTHHDISIRQKQQWALGQYPV
jgi:hypothetical protein